MKAGVPRTSSTRARKTTPARSSALAFVGCVIVVAFSVHLFPIIIRWWGQGRGVVDGVLPLGGFSIFVVVVLITVVWTWVVGDVGGGGRDVVGWVIVGVGTEGVGDYVGGGVGGFSGFAIAARGAPLVDFSINLGGGVGAGDVGDVVRRGVGCRMMSGSSVR